MKSVLETGVYLFIMAYICWISVDFVTMNMSISHVDEVENYIEDYIEAHGVRMEDNSLDEATVNFITEYANENGMTVTVVYKEETKAYSYYDMSLKYKVRSRMFNLGKEHSYDGVVRIEKLSEEEVEEAELAEG